MQVPTEGKSNSQQRCKQSPEATIHQGDARWNQFAAELGQLVGQELARKGILGRRDSVQNPKN